MLNPGLSQWTEPALVQPLGQRPRQTCALKWNALKDMENVHQGLENRRGYGREDVCAERA